MKQFACIIIWLCSLVNLPSSFAQQWNWATMAGGQTGSDICKGMAYDSQGNVYWVGSVNGNVNFSGQNFSTTVPCGSIAKYNASGTLIWVKTISSNSFGNDISANGIAIDSQDRIYICGSFVQDATFSPLINLNSPGNGSEIFLASYDTSGNVLWAVKQGATSPDYGTSVCTDFTGHVYLLTRLSNNLVWFKYDSSGNMIFSFSPTVVGPNGQTNFIDPTIINYKNGRLFYSGILSNRQADFGNGVLLGSVSRADAFAICSDTLGNLIWGRSFNSFNSSLFGNAVDENFNTLFVGFFSNYIVVDGDTIDENGTNYDAILLSLDSTGNTIFKKSISGTGRDQVRAARSGPFHTWYIGGEIKSQNSVTPVDVLGISVQSQQNDVFLARISAAGSAEWVKLGEASGNDYSTSMEFDTINQRLYIGGLSSGASVWGNSTINSAGLSDALMAQLTDTTAFLPPPNLPQVSITAIDVNCYNACNGEVSINITGGFPPYSVLFDTVLISGNNISNLCAGNYQLSITDSLGQTTGTSFTIAQPDSLYVTWTIDLICDPPHYYIEAFGFGGVQPYNFLWPDSSQDYFYFPGTNDTSQVEVLVTDANGCTTSLSESLLPYVPLDLNLQQSFDTLFFNQSLSSFQWFLDGVAQSSTDTFLVILADGNYWISFVDSYGCTGYSDTVLVDIATVIEESNKEQFHLKPNPGNGIFQLITGGSSVPVQVQLFNAQGQKVMELSGNKSLDFDLSGYESGIYWLRISRENNAPQHLRLLKY
jgi:hypothetical protein